MSLRLNADTCGKEIEISKLRSAKIHVLPSTEHLMPAQKAEETTKKHCSAVSTDPENNIMQCGTFHPDCKVVDRICMHMTWRLAVSAA